MKIIKIYCKSVFILLLLCILCGNAIAGQKKRTQENNTAQRQTDTLVLPIKFYRNTISKADGNRCRMEPSCSKFCIDALTKHGFLLGWIMCSDRLLRCGRDEGKISAPIWINGEKRIYDPVSNNDFWW